MGGGSFHQGKALGFPARHRRRAVHAVGDRFCAQGFHLTRDDHSTLGAGWVQAEVGLPANINIIARGGDFVDAKMYGGGVRVGLLTPSVPLTPAISVTALYDKLNHDYVDAHTWSANAVLSVDVPFIHPYLGVRWGPH